MSRNVVFLNLLKQEFVSPFETLTPRHCCQFNGPHSLQCAYVIHSVKTFY